MGMRAREGGRERRERGGGEGERFTGIHPFAAPSAAVQLINQLLL